jgi:hypothetical protein
MEKIHWATKVRRAKIWQIYQNDAAGAVDEELLLDVGYALYERCRCVLMVTRGQVECPRCGNVFELGRFDGQGAVKCPSESCGWEITPDHYHSTWRHQDLLGGNILPDAESYARNFPEARSSQERMVLIDRLIHAFHWDAVQGKPNRSAANNFIEGSHGEIVDMLERLASAPDPQAKQRWRDTVTVMMKRRRGEKPDR